LGMTLVKLPILSVLIGQFPAVDDEQVLSVPFLGSFCEIEGSSNYYFIVDNHGLIVGNGVPARRSAAVLSGVYNRFGTQA
jgi:hypothetical protein